MSLRPQGGLAPGCALAAATLAVSAPAAQARPPKPIPVRTSIPLGSSLWYACTDPAYGGAALLACPVHATSSQSAETQALAYTNAFAKYFDRFTPENEFKMVWTRPSAATYDFKVADKVASFAQARNLHIRGHTLLYAQADPDWVTHPTVPWTKRTLSTVIDQHISNLVTHFRTSFPGVVDEWDVVNEPFRDDGSRDPSVFQNVIGDGWIEEAFRDAAAADPAATLILNDFAADVENPRQRAVLALVKDFVARGVPIDGVGLQMHLGSDGTYPTVQQLDKVMGEYGALGLRVEVTEADALPIQGADAQRAALDTAAEACRLATNCTEMTVWGVADPYSWRGPNQHADLLGADLQPKDAYADVRCRLDDPKPASGDWMEQTCPGTPLGEIAALPPAPTPTTAPPDPTPVPVLPDPVPVTVASVAAPPVLAPVSPAPPSRAAPGLKIVHVRRFTHAVRISGVVAAVSEGRITVTFGHRRVTATVRRHRFSVRLRLHGAAARVHRGKLSVRFAGSPHVLPAVVTRTVVRR